MNLLGLSIVDLQKVLSNKDVSSEELYSYFVNRIATYDKELNSFLSIVYDHKDQETKNGLLSGIPIAIKDSYCTLGLRTTAASKLLDSFSPPYESTVTQKLKDAGALIIGKNNMDAWAHGSSTETSDYGPSCNPWDTSRVPGGSSGGSAAAVAAYLSPGSIGSETAGSIRLPASWCGAVGLKPTYGRVSRYGLIAMGSSWDCPAPLTRTVRDAALVLSVIAGHDPYDATSSTKLVPDYVSALEGDKKLTIGICEEYFDGVDDEVKKHVEGAILLFEKMGHKTKRIHLLSPKYAISVYTILQRSEVSSNLARYDGVRYGENREAFADEAKRRIMFGTYLLSHGYYESFYKQAKLVRELIAQDFTKVFTDVDVIVAPSAPITALPIGEWEKYPFFGELMDKLCEPASAAGIPAISIPVGLDSHGLPIGLQIMGRHFDEETVLNLAYQFERETDFFGITSKILEKYQ